MWVIATILVRELFVVLDQEVAVVVHRRPLDDGSAPLAQKMPGHDVGVVLHDREDDLVPLPDQARPAHGGGHEVVGLGRVAGEDDLVCGGRVEELARGLARALEPFGRGVGHVVQAAMDVGVAGLHAGDHRVDHRPRLLRRGGVVEIDQRLAVDLFREDRELLPDRLDVVGGGGDGCVHVRDLGSCAVRVHRRPPEQVRRH
jgi:hypothetical protein